MTSKQSGGRFYCKDGANNVTLDFDTLNEALETARELIEEYRNDTILDIEWSDCIEDITVGEIIDSSNDDNNITLYKATFLLVPDQEEECYDVMMLLLNRENDNDSVPGLS